MNYITIGNGKTRVVFLHGFLFDFSIWESLITEEVRKLATCLLIDLPGHGESPVLDKKNSIEDWAKEVDKVLKHIGWHDAAFVGHSMGGYVALTFAKMYPEKMNGLFLLNSNSLADSEEKKANRYKSIELASENKKSFIRSSIPNLFLAESIKKFSNEYKNVLEIAQKTSLLGLANAQRAMAERENTTEVLHQSSCVKTLVFGKFDPLLDFENQLKELEGIENLNIKILETAHMSQIEDKNSVEKALIGFLKKLQ